MTVEYRPVRYIEDLRIEPETVSAFHALAKAQEKAMDALMAEELLRMNDPKAYAELIATRQANFEAREREAWLALPQWKRGYIIFGKWLRAKTKGTRQVLISWLEWDDIGWEG